MSKLFQGVGNLLGYTFNSLDQTSAANDVIVVRHKDGSLHSSPFNVRFGRAKVLRPTDKIVSISVNGQKTSTCMKMGEDGVAVWLVPTTAEVRSDLLSSPIQSPRSDSSFEAPDPRRSPPSPGLTDTVVSTPGNDGSATGAAERHLDPQRNVGPESNPPTAAPTFPLAVVEPHTAEVESVGASGVPAPTTIDNSRSASPDHPPPGQPPFPLVDVPEDPEKLGRSYEELLVSLDTEKRQVEAPPLVVLDAPQASASSPHPAPPLRLSRFASSAEDVAAHHQRLISETEEEAEEESVTSSETDDLEFFEDRARTVANATASGDAEGKAGNGAPPEVHYRRSFQPISADLEKLGLAMGANKIVFTTNSRLRGSVSVEASIYLWDSDDKIVVSDIDGTITKSDVLGHILPKIGKDWTHPGICDLYSQIARNGYKFLYVTARSVSQIESTKGFVFSVMQKGVALPKGPLITAPDRLWDAITQEVGKRSHEFKIACLKSVAAAFPKHGKPFYAGFGNRIGDVIAYTAAAIPKHKIFIIDATSAVHVASVRQTYSNLAELVDVTFPPVSYVVHGCRRTQQPDMQEGEGIDQAFNSYNFWRLPAASYFHPSQVPHGESGAAAAGTVAADRASLRSGDSNRGQSISSKEPSPALRPKDSSSSSPRDIPLPHEATDDTDSPGKKPPAGSEKPGGWRFWNRTKST